MGSRSVINYFAFSLPHSLNFYKGNFWIFLHNTEKLTDNNFFYIINVQKKPIFRGSFNQSAVSFTAAQARPPPWAHHLRGPIKSDEHTGNNIIIPIVLGKKIPNNKGHKPEWINFQWGFENHSIDNWRLCVIRFKNHLAVHSD